MKSCENCKHGEWSRNVDLQIPAMCIDCKYIEKGGLKVTSNWKPILQTNADRIRAMSDEELAELFQPILREHGVETSDELAGKAAGIMKERMTLTTDMWDLTSFFFVAPTEYEEKLAKKQWKGDNPTMLGKLRGVLEGIEDFSKENTETVVRAWLEAEGYSLGQVMNTLRLALVGAGKGPGMFDVTEFIGKEECLKRIDTILATLKPLE